MSVCSHESRHYTHRQALRKDCFKQYPRALTVANVVSDQASQPFERSTARRHAAINSARRSAGMVGV